jgi:hypothetical protein
VFAPHFVWIKQKITLPLNGTQVKKYAVFQNQKRIYCIFYYVNYAVLLRDVWD